MSFDSIALKSTLQWFQKHGIRPSQWGLRDAEKERILSSNIKITITNPPASCLSLVNAGQPHYLIMIDPRPLEEEKITAREQIGILLHEIGHIVNPQTVDSIDSDYSLAMAGVNEDEVFADDYTKHCDYADEFASAMTKMKTIMPKAFGANSIDERIKLLEDKARKPHLNLIAPRG